MKLDSITDAMNMDLSKLRETVRDRRQGMLQSRGRRVRHDWAMNNNPVRQ